MLLTRIENKIVDDMTPKQVRHVQPVPVELASSRVAELYAQIRRDLQLVPPLTMLSPAPELLAGVWSVWRESQFAVGRVPRPVTEAVATAVSRINACPYCVDAHSGMLHASSDHDVVEAILHDDWQAIGDEKMRSIVEWAMATRTPGAEVLRRAPFTRDEAPEIIGTAVVYHFVNRMVNIFLSDSPLPVPSGRTRLHRMVARIFGATLGKRLLRRSPPPGDSLRFVPHADLPGDLAWAAPNASIAASFAGFVRLVDEAGREALPDDVRELVMKNVGKWRGEDKGLSQGWVEEAIGELEREHKPAGRLAILTALAAYRVDEKTLAAFRANEPGDDRLLGATAWASFTAARRIAGWLQTDVDKAHNPAGVSADARVVAAAGLTGPTISLPTQ